MQGAIIRPPASQVTCPAQLALMRDFFAHVVAICQVAYIFKCRTTTRTQANETNLRCKNVDFRVAAILRSGVDIGNHRNHGVMQMNIESLSRLSSILMYAHADVAYSLGRLVGGTTDKCGVAKNVTGAIRGVDKALAAFRESGFDSELYLDVEIEINANAVPAKVWFVLDLDEPYVVAVVADGVDVMQLISQDDLDEHKADFIAKCIKLKAESEADDAFSYKCAD